MKQIPTLYKQYPFFDDGKYGLSRFYVTTVVKIMTVDEAKKHTIFLHEIDPVNPNCCKISTLYDIWKEAVESHKDRIIYPHDENNYWCYAPETDYFIVCAIPEYDDSLIFFARHVVNGNWFSFNTTGSWQCGLLDVDCSKFSGYKEDYPEAYNKYKDLFGIEEPT